MPRVQNLTSQILLQHQRLCQPTVRNSRRPPRPKQPSRPPTKVSCSTWVQNTEESNCSQKALGNCAISTVQLASFVALSDHNNATYAAFATAILHSVNFVRISFRTDSPDIRIQRPAVRPPATSSELPASASRRTFGRQPADPLDATKPHHSEHGLHRTRHASRRASPSLRDGTPAKRVSRYATAWAECLEGAMSSHQSWALLCRCRCRFSCGVDRNSEMKLRLRLWETGQIRVLGKQKRWTASQNRKKGAAADRRTAREASLCLDSPRIHRQSHELIGRRCSAGLSRLPQKLDYSSHPTELEHWDSSHQRGLC